MHDQTTKETTLFIELIKHSPMLRELQGASLDREALSRQLGVSIATSYRLTGWLSEKNLIEDADGVFVLTALGEVIADVISTFETDVRTMLCLATTPSDLLIDLIRHFPMLKAVHEEALDRQELEHRLDMSRATSHRHTKSLTEKGLIERSNGNFTLTEVGEVVTGSVSTFETNTRTALHLAPVIGAIYGTTPRFDIAAFADATVTSAEHGDAYSPMTRFVSLLQKTESVRGFDTFSIAPTYLEEFQQRILDGMRTEIIDPPAVTADVMTHFPEKCVQVCASDYFTLWVHDDLPYGLVLFDDRIGIGVRDAKTRTLRTFVDTDSGVAREWAEAVYELYKAEAVRLGHFTQAGLEEAMATMRSAG